MIVTYRLVDPIVNNKTKPNKPDEQAKCELAVEIKKLETQIKLMRNGVEELSLLVRIKE